MKKVMFVMIAILLLFAPAMVLAAEPVECTTGADCKMVADNGELISTLSNKVTLGAVSAGDAYAAVSGHSAGNKLYASTSGDTKIYTQTSDPVTVATPSNSDTAQFATGGGWSPL
ncbi:MAG: hypothetical protein RQ754_16730 [Desulfuromonadales bacterium]|nr:hypothetical protein [Desulfuromonadales bacterium]